MGFEINERKRRIPPSSLFLFFIAFIKKNKIKILTRIDIETV